MVRLAPEGLLWVEEVADGDGFVAVWAEAAEADAGAGLVAVVAPLLAEVGGVAGRAAVDGDVPAPTGGGDWFGGWGRRGSPSGPGGLAAVVRAVLLPTDADETGGA